MPTLEQTNRRLSESSILRKTIAYTSLTSILLTIYLFYTYGFIGFIAEINPILYWLYIPFALLMVILFRKNLSFTDYRKPLRYILGLFCIVYGGIILFDFIGDWYYKPQEMDKYALAIVLVAMLYTFFVGTEKSKLNTVLSSVSVALIIVSTILSFHIFINGMLLIERKAKLSLKRSLVTRADLQNIVVSLGTKDPDEFYELNKDPFIQILNGRGILQWYQANQIEDQYSPTFRVKHADAIERARRDTEQINSFFPSGLYLYKTSFFTNQYFLRNIHVLHSERFKGKDEVILIFEKKDRSIIHVYETYDSDGTDSVFTAQIKSDILGYFDVIGHYKFTKTLDELKTGTVALTIEFSNISSIEPAEYTYFKPDLQN